MLVQAERSKTVVDPRRICRKYLSDSGDDQKGNKVILLHGFQKKSQKTPKQDMEIAQQRQRRYFQRHGYL
ncbi:MAG: hypothetical protein DME70_08505 [Verrucomicrobia bacterium]|nr:MAG: hypothetical protein DME70_08505 [Verrucomicrobiota bacterium]